MCSFGEYYRARLYFYISIENINVFLDKDVCYIKTLESKGQFQIKEYDLVEKSHNADTKENGTIDLSSYAKTSDLDHILCEINMLKEQLSKFKQGGTQNGTTTKPTNTTTATTN